MFKVICTGKPADNRCHRDAPFVFEIGQSLTVEDQWDWFGKMFYAFAGARGLFAAKYFSPIDGPDQRNLLDQRCAEADQEMRELFHEIESA